jgi:hypothetical protein
MNHKDAKEAKNAKGRDENYKRQMTALMPALITFLAFFASSGAFFASLWLIQFCRDRHP